MKKSEENILSPSKFQRALAFLAALAVSLHIPVAMLLKGSNKKSEKALPTSNESIIATTFDDPPLDSSIILETQTTQIEEESRKSCPFLTNYESGKEYSFSIDGQVYTELTCRGTISDPGMPNLLDNKKTEFPGYEATKTVYTFSSSTGKAYVQIRELKNSANTTCVYSVDTYIYAIPLSEITLSNSDGDAIMYLSDDMLLKFNETFVTDAGKEAGFNNATEACVTVETALGSAPFYGYSCTVTETVPTKDERSEPTKSLLP